MKLRVSPQAGMWGFNGLWLTFADPQPLELKEEQLDQATKDAIQKALQRGALIDLDAPKVTSKTPALKIVTPVVSNEPVSGVIPLALKQRLMALLDNGVTTLRREIALIRHTPTLTWALRMEKEGKNRKTIIGLLEKQLLKYGNHMIYDDIVKEEEGETITLKLERMSIVSVEEKNPEGTMLEVTTEISPLED